MDTTYSPIQPISYQSLNPIDVKRDDLIDPYISGNKWRKLKYVLAKANSLGRTHLVTFGGAYSNHLLATAAASARAGLKVTAFVRGEAVENEMLLLCRLFGMQLIFVDRSIYRHKTDLFNLHFEKDSAAFFIDEGGASAEAVKGCAEIIDELGQEYDYIFCAAGTGTTAAGLLSGINRLQLKTELHVIPVLNGADFIEREIAKYVGHTAGLQLHLDYHFGGYAKTTPVLLNFMSNFIAQTGVLIDPVYTAKMFFAINDLKLKGKLKDDAKILAIHTGGLMGILGMKEKLGKLFL